MKTILLIFFIGFANSIYCQFESSVFTNQIDCKRYKAYITLEIEKINNIYYGNLWIEDSNGSKKDANVVTLRGYEGKNQRNFFILMNKGEWCKYHSKPCQPYHSKCASHIGANRASHIRAKCATRV